MKDKLRFAVQLILYSVVKFWRFWLAFVLIIFGAYYLRSCRDNRNPSENFSAKVEADSLIDVTPEQLRQIRQIGEWEFLAVETEELVSLSEAGFFRDKQLACIFTGTLRVGVDLGKCSDDWFEAKADTAVLYLPSIELLDRNFIDEPRTRVFYESGQWDASDKERLYEMARAKMQRSALTKENLSMARQNATTQISNLFFSLGYKFTVIHYGESRSKPAP